MSTPEFFITPDDAALALVQAQFTGWQVVTMGAIGMAESRLNLFAFNPNSHDSTKVTYLWPDVGWLQVNTFWARYFLLNVTYGPLLSPVGNARRARRVWEEAGGLKDPTLGYERWNTYKSEAYNDALPKARLAARAAGEKV